MDLRIDTQVFHKNLTKLYELWNDSKDGIENINGSPINSNPLANVDIILLACGRNEFVSYNKTSSLQEWLFGVDISDSVILFGRDEILCYASRKKINYLDPISTNSKIPVRFYIRQNSNEDEYFLKIVGHIRSGDKVNTVGTFLKDRFDGVFIEKWNKCLSDNHISQIVDVSCELSKLMCIKDADEISNIQVFFPQFALLFLYLMGKKVASDISCNIFNKFFKSKLLDLIESNKKVKQSDLADQLEDCTDKKLYYPNSTVREEDVEIAFPVIIQSGGNYSIKFSIESNDDILKFDVIVFMLGVRYKYYCSCLVRTLMVNPSNEHQKHYKLVQESFDVVINSLKPGKQLKDCYEAFRSFFQKKDKNLLKYLPRNVGFSTGIEFRDASLLLDANNATTIKPNMTFNVLVMLNNVEIGASKYSFSIGDTVKVIDSGAAVCTKLTKRQLGGVTIRVDESSDESEDSMKDAVSSQIESESSNEGVSLIRESRGVSGTVGTRHRKLPKRETAEDTEYKRRTHQKELSVKLNESAMKRYLDSKSSTNPNVVSSISNSPNSSFICYHSVREIPREKDVTEMRIHVDKTHDCIVLPIMGIAVPFHISTIKNINTSLESDYMYLRINFTNPLPVNNWATEKNKFKCVAYGSIKEIIYRCLNIKEIGKAYPDSSHLVNVFRLVKELQKKFRTQQAEQKELQGIVKQDDLQLSTNKNLPRLKHLLMRPAIGNRRAVVLFFEVYVWSYKSYLQGYLEVHQNGFRYSPAKSEHIDVIFSNIKHAFYQDPLLYGKKKLHDVQFYAETVTAVSDLDKNSFATNRNDPDEIEAEERELENIQRINNTFKHFCEAVETLTDGRIEFDTPFKDLGFDGVPTRLSIFLTPTTHCLVNLMEIPFFVLSLNEIELVHFERVQANTKHFDMVFVFKDYSKKVVMVGCVPMSNLESIKDWLDSCDIKYSEGIQSLNWARVMKTINDDPKDFFETGGWSFLDPESDREGSADDGANDSEEDNYNPDSSDDDEDDESEYDESSQESSPEFEEESVEDEPSDALTWDELEDLARKEDENKHRSRTVKSPVKRGPRQVSSNNPARKKSRY